MKIEIIRHTIASKRSVSPGETLDVPQAEGFELISAGKAIAIKENIAETTEKVTPAIERGVTHTGTKKSTKKSEAEDKSVAPADDEISKG